MRLRRSLVFWGLLLIPLGGIPLLARAGVVPDGLIADPWRLWPLALIGVGLLLIVGRTRASIAATAMVALVIGSIAGAAFAAGPPWIATMTDCGFQPGSATERLDRAGAWDGRASVRLDLRCGSLDLHPAADASWHVGASYRGAAPSLVSSGRALAVTAPTGTHRQDWTVQLPATALDRIDLSANAAASTIRLDGIPLGTLSATVNAGDLTITVGSGSLERIEATANAGRIRVAAGATGLRGTISINAGAVDLCVASDADLRLTVTDQLTFAHNLSSRGLTRTGDGAWVRSGSGRAVILRIDGNAAALTLDFEGGCR
jgi:hypothetical protein